MVTDSDRRAGLRPLESVGKMEEIRKCIREAARVMDRTAGVTDGSGSVIACTDERREGAEDMSARAFGGTDDRTAIAAGRSYLRLTAADRQGLSACIEGPAPTSRTYLELLGRWIEAALKERNTDAERESFLKNVLLENELPGDIPLKAREYRISFHAPRVVFLVRIDRGESVGVLEILQGLFPEGRREHVLAMDEETFVLVSELDGERGEFSDRVARTIVDNLNAESMARVHIGIGMTAENLKDTAKSYREALMALTVGGIFESDRAVVRYDQLGLGRLIYQLPTTLCNMFLDEVFPKGAYESLDSETLLTIQKFFENNLNGSETSRQLFVHRNTLVYRLDKVQKITSLDLRRFDDAVLFKLASMVRRYLERQGHGPSGRAADGRGLRG